MASALCIKTGMRKRGVGEGLRGIVTCACLCVCVQRMDRGGVDASGAASNELVNMAASRR